MWTASRYSRSPRRAPTREEHGRLSRELAPGLIDPATSVTAHTPSNLGRRIAVGAGWMIGLRFADRGIGLVSIAILARLLVPQDFGLVALAVSFIAIVSAFAQLGVEVALIQEQRAERLHYDSAWTINLIAGTLLSLALVAFASPAAAFFSEPRVESTIRWLAVANLIRSFENIGVVDFRKNLEFHREFKFLFSVRCISTVFTVVVAYLWRDYMALVAGTVMQAAIRVGLSYTMSAYRPSLTLAASGSILRFSKWMMVQVAIEAVGGQASSLIIGRIANATAVAHYNVASEIANLATTELAAPVRRALLPGFAKIGNDKAALRRTFVNSFAVIVLVGLPVPVGIALIAPMIVAVFLGPQWTPAVALIQVLSVSGILRTFGTSSHLIYLAIGRPRITAILSAVRLIFDMHALIAGASYAGALGAAWTSVIAGALLWMLDFGILHRILRFDPRELWAVAWRPVVAAMLMYIGLQELQAALPSAQSLIATIWQLLANVALGMAIYVGAVFVLWRLCRRPEGSETAVLGLLRRRSA